MTTKVELQREAPRFGNDTIWRARVLRALPYFTGPEPEHVTHRVRRGSVHRSGRHWWVSFTFWCGNGGFLRHRHWGRIKGGELSDRWPMDHRLCIRCEHAAVRAGQPSTPGAPA